MSQPVRLFGLLLVASILLTAGAPVAVGAHEDDRTPPPPSGGVQTLIPIGTPNGVSVLHVENPNGIRAMGYVSIYFQPYEAQILRVDVVDPQGRVTPADQIAVRGDFVGWGDETVYAGVDDPLVSGPPIRPADPVSLSGDATIWFDVPGRFKTEAWFIVWWADFPDVEDRGFYLFNWTDGTTVTRFYDGTRVGTYEMQDFRSGARAAALPPGVVVWGGLRANLGDRLDFEADGGLLYGAVAWTRSPYHAKGEFTVRSKDLDKTLDLHVDPEPYPNSVTGCFCVKIGHWIFTTDSDLGATLNYLGDGRNANVNLSVVWIPAGILPSGLWWESVW